MQAHFHLLDTETQMYALLCSVDFTQLNVADVLCNMQIQCDETQRNFKKHKQCLCMFITFTLIFLTIAMMSVKRYV